jgi:predicted tellurium resistance membrane protein TerC
MTDLLALFQDPNVWAALLTLTAMEIVLGIDNLIFIAILTSRLPPQQQPTARRIGIGLALISRLALLSAITWLMRLTTPVITLLGQALSWRDLILILGGLFLVYKGTVEIHHRMEEAQEPGALASGASGFASIITQIIVIDMVFSLDSIITAVGMSDHISVMVIAVIVSVVIMLVAANPLSDFVTRHPTVKMLALSFLLLIGTVLIAEGFGFHVPKAYVYVAMAFSVLVETLNLIVASRRRRRT